MRILHFSDIHFGRPAWSPASFFDKRLLGTFNYIIRRRGNVDEMTVQRLLYRIPQLKPDLIVCSGDITCVGSREEFTAATDALTPFTEIENSPFLYVPGNHDAYVPRKVCTEALAETCRKLNPPSCGNLLTHGFEDLSVAGVDVAMLSLAHPTNIFLSCGTLSETNALSLENWCKKRKENHVPKVLIGHFPTQKADGTPLGFRRHLRGGKHIAGKLENGDINLYLCGHIHSPFTRSLPGGSLECCTGSLTMKKVYSVIDIDPGGNITHEYEML